MNKEAIEISVPEYTRLIQKALAYDTIASATYEMLAGRSMGTLSEYEHFQRWFISSLVDLEV